MKRMMRACRLALSILMLACLFTGCGKKEDKKIEVLSVSQQLYVTDDADILSEETEAYIVSRVNALKALCGGEIAVATIDFLPFGLNSEEYAYELINQWGVGDKEKNNGVVLLLVPGEAKGWITAGLGIEGSLTAGKLDRILNLYLWPDFDAGRYDIAVCNTVDAVIEWYEDYYGISVGQSASAPSGAMGGGTAAQPYYEDDDDSMTYLIAFIIFFIIVMSFMSRAGGVVRRRRVTFFPIFFGGPRRPPFGGGFGPGLGGPNMHNRPPMGGFGGGSNFHDGGGSFRGGGGFGGGGGRGGGAGRR